VAALEVVQTARLRGHRPALGDADALAGIVADPAVIPTLWAHGPPTAGQVHAMLAADLRHWQRHGWGAWLWTDRAGGDVISRAGVEHTRVAGEDVVELAYAISGSRWGEGLATEIAHESVRIAFDDLGLDELVAFTLTTNRASQRVMEKAGFAYERPIEHAGLPHVLYRRAR